MQKASSNCCERQKEREREVQRESAYEVNNVKASRKLWKLFKTGLPKSLLISSSS